jgi:hypothetical protein
MLGRSPLCWLTHTIPELIRIATAFARSVSRPQTTPPKPQGESLTRSIVGGAALDRPGRLPPLPAHPASDQDGVEVIEDQ